MYTESSVGILNTIFNCTRSAIYNLIHSGWLIDWLIDSSIDWFIDSLFGVLRRIRNI